MDLRSDDDTLDSPAAPRGRGLPRSAARVLHKGQQTRAAILEAALGLASHMGLEGLSIGALAEVTQMSKSGVFAHFGSREELQISVIREYHQRFEDEVFFPAIQQPRGLPRLRAMFENWVKRVSVEIDSGCIYISGAVSSTTAPAPCATRWPAWCAPGTRPWKRPSAWASAKAICAPTPTPNRCCSSCMA